MVALTGELGEPPASLVDLWAIDALRGIGIDGGRSRSAPSRPTRRSAARSSAASTCPALVEAAATIGAAQIQNRGTLGGNIANASPAGDTLPVLLAADAVFVLGSARGEREVAGRRVLVRLPHDGARPRRTGAAHPDPARRRIARCASGRSGRGGRSRSARSCSRSAWRSTPALSRGPWRDVRVALGSVAATPIRARATEAALEGRAPNPETADLAAETLAGELSPIEDVRSTAEYRRLVAARILHRIVREAGGW